MTRLLSAGTPPLDEPPADPLDVSVANFALLAGTGIGLGLGVALVLLVPWLAVALLVAIAGYGLATGWRR